MEIGGNTISIKESKFKKGKKMETKTTKSPIDVDVLKNKIFHEWFYLTDVRATGSYQWLPTFGTTVDVEEVLSIGSNLLMISGGGKSLRVVKQDKYGLSALGRLHMDGLVTISRKLERYGGKVIALDKNTKSVVDLSVAKLLAEIYVFPLI